MLDKPGIEMDLAAAIRKCINDNPQDRYAAGAALYELVLQHAALREELIAPLLKGACQDKVDYAVRQDNSARWEGTKKKGAETVDRLHGSRLAVNRMSNLMNYMLLGNVPLGEATVEILRENKIFQRKQAQTMNQKADWFEKIEVRLVASRKKKVKQALTVTDLAAMAREAQFQPA